MCTAVTYKTKDFYFGRTLDYEFSYGEEVTITPRNYPFQFRNGKFLSNHYALIGMAHVAETYPLYYEAVNECGLGMAGLNFPNNAVYNEKINDKDNVAQFELIPWLLGKCASVKEVKDLLKCINITNEPFNNNFPVSPLHWLIADSKECIVVEAVCDGLKIYYNPVGVMTNNPTFDKQLFNLNNYRHLSNKELPSTFSDNLKLESYSRGLGALGLPGDVSSMSRFVRAAFVKMNSVSSDDEISSVNQFFHILNSIEQVRGCCKLKENTYEITIYSSCCNATKGIYYYTTYNNHQINAIDMHKENLDGDKLIRYSLLDNEQINHFN
mgnify:FL=1